MQINQSFKSHFSAFSNQKVAIYKTIVTHFNNNPSQWYFTSSASGIGLELLIVTVEATEASN